MRSGMLFVGDDWAEDHHDVEIVDDDGRRLAQRRLPEQRSNRPQIDDKAAQNRADRRD